MAARRTKKNAAVRDLTRKDLADELDVHAETIGRYDRDGAPREKRGRSHYYNAPEYLAWMKARGLTGEKGKPVEGGNSPDLQTAKLRKENALAAKYELQVQRESGELMPVEQVKRWIGEHVSAAKNKLIGLGARIAPSLHGRDAAECQAMIDARVIEILDELAST